MLSSMNIDLDDFDLPSTDLNHDLLDAFPSLQEPLPESVPLPQLDRNLVEKICSEKKSMKRRRGHGRATSDPEALRRAASMLSSEFDVGTVTSIKPLNHNIPEGLMDIDFFNGDFSAPTNQDPFDFSSVSPLDAINLFVDPQGIFAVPAKKRMKKERNPSTPKEAKITNTKITKKDAPTELNEQKDCSAIIRGKYTCGRCGLPKEGHICTVPLARSVASQVDLNITRSANCMMALLNLGSTCKVLEASANKWHMSSSKKGGFCNWDDSVAVQPLGWQASSSSTMKAALSAF
jgi:hypothetical protein